MRHEPKESAAASRNAGARRGPLRQYLLAAALAAAQFAACHAMADAPVPQKNDASDAPGLNGKAVPLPDFTELVRRVKPAVVSVRVKEPGPAELVPDDDFANPFKGTPFEKLFRNFGGRWKLRPVPVEAQGSGFFISEDGYIVTNNHVVDNATEVQVVTDSGDVLKATVAGTDKLTDLALLKVESDRKFPFVALSHDKPEIGQWIVAMGNPFGLGGTVTAGIVSARSRNIGEGPYDDFLQIDAPINRGNSGGPTFNMKGEVIGVNTAIFSPSGGSVGIAFDIPASTVESVIPQLQKTGYVRRGWLGVQIQPVTREIADSLGLKEAEGALITAPQPGSPAEGAGLKSGDIITAVNGETVKDARDLARKIAGTAPGTQVTLTVVREGKTETFKLKIGHLMEREARHEPRRQNKHSQIGKLGLELVPAYEAEGAGSEGLLIAGVEPGSEAANLGLTEGDVILKAGGKTVSTPGELRDALEAAKAAGRKFALLLVRHRQNEIYVAVPVSAG